MSVRRSYTRTGPSHEPARHRHLTRTVRALLALHGFEPFDDTTVVMAHVDREEAHYAEQAARALGEEGVTVDITPQLREEIDTEWAWANHPVSWCSREEIREVSNDAQKIYDAIRHGHLIIHAHAHDGWATVAVGFPVKFFCSVPWTAETASVETRLARRLI